MSLAAGTCLGPYEIESAIGAGGMGAVYKARDTRLGRTVAIKVLPPDVGADPERRARFEREARTVAGLSHPNICPLFDVGDHDGAMFLVMEHLTGETLAGRLEKGRLPLDRVLAIATEIADALSAAHRQGVIHRDLKPANVMLTGSGAKLLDFGLATQRAWAEPADAEAPTALRTSIGALVGTPAYMSPEQAEGHPADARSDLFSLGVLLYEAATGMRPFTGSSPLAILSSILRDTPVPVSRRNPAIPPALAGVIDRLLEKDPDRRYQTADEVRAALDTDESGSAEAVHARGAHLPKRLAWFALAVAAAGGLITWTLTPGQRPLSIENVALVTPEEGTETRPSLSPDGNWVAYGASGELYLRRVGAENPIHLTADFSSQAGEPAFSPDGRLIAFSASRDDTDLRGGIWIMEITGSGKRRLSDAGFSPAWSPDGKEIAFASERPTPYDRPRFSRLSVIDATSGRARQLGVEDSLEPAWSPAGGRLAYWGVARAARRDIWTRPVAGGAPSPVTSDDAVDWSPVWSHDGRHLFFCSDRGGSPNLWRVRIDEPTGRPLGEPEPLTAPAPAVMRVSFAADGSRFAYEASDLQANVQRIGFNPIEEAVRGDPVALTSGTRVWMDVDVSGDGRLVVRSARRQEDIYVGDPDGKNLTALAPDAGNDRFPRWSPDGARIAFSSTKGDGGYEIHTVRPDGSDLRRMTFFEPSAVHFPLWSPDGRRLAFTAYVSAGGQTYVIDADGEWPAGPLKPLLTPPEPLDLRYRPWSWSPDGRRIAAYSERGAGMIVYDVASGSYEEISRLGAKPRWLSDSRRLVYTFDGALHLMDTRTKLSKEIFRSPAGAVIDPVVSRDDRTLYYILRREEGSIWVAALK